MLLVAAALAAGCGQSKKELLVEIKELQTQKEHLTRVLATNAAPKPKTWQNVNEALLELEQERDRTFRLMQEKTAAPPKTVRIGPE